MKRYQECNKIEKIWRSRWKLVVPFVASYYYITRKKVYLDVNTAEGITHTKHFEYLSYKMCWRIARGEVDSKRNFYYTHEEVMKKFNINDEDI